jgi:hypothetical protein
MTAPNPSPANIEDFAAYRARDYRRIVEDLHTARAEQACGPQVLQLVNELACMAEDILNYRCDENGLPQSVCCPEAARFIAELTRQAERIRARNGELDDRFFALIEALPTDQAQAA